MENRRLWKQLLTKKSVGAAHCQRTMFDFCEFITMLEPKVKKRGTEKAKFLPRRFLVVAGDGFQWKKVQKKFLRKLSSCPGVFW